MLMKLSDLASPRKNICSISVLESRLVVVVGREAEELCGLLRLEAKEGLS